MADNDEEAAAAAQAPPFNLNLELPDPVCLAGKNALEVWKLWKQIWENLLHCDESQESACTLSKIITHIDNGNRKLQIYNGSDPLDTDSAEDIIRKLDTHILGQTNETFERYKFNIRSQKHDESYDTYLPSLKTLAKSCDFCFEDFLLCYQCQNNAAQPNWCHNAGAIVAFALTCTLVKKTLYQAKECWLKFSQKAHERVNQDKLCCIKSTKW